LNISKANLDQMLQSPNPEIRRVLGIEGNFGEALGVSKDWVVRIVRHVGNYGEMFDRHLGAGSRLGIARGLNALWTKGGLQYAPPIR
jgi:general L-amino acid transport system substrate-binding protein